MAVTVHAPPKRRLRRRRRNERPASSSSSPPSRNALFAAALTAAAAAILSASRDTSGTAAKLFCHALYVEQLSPPTLPSSSASTSGASSHRHRPPPSIANVGGTVPERVMAEYAEYNNDDNRSNGRRHSATSGLGRLQGGGRAGGGTDSFFYWLDNLNPQSCREASQRYHALRDDPHLRRGVGEDDLVPSSSSSSSQRRRRPAGRRKQRRRRRRREPFSLLSWNILSQTLYETNLLINEVPQPQPECCRPIPWNVRLHQILSTLSSAQPDIICLQEVEFDLFYSTLLPAMQERGYDGVVQGSDDVREIKRRSNKERRRHVVATFWRRGRFRPVEMIEGTESKDGSREGYAHMARGRTLTSVLADMSGEEEADVAEVDDDDDDDDDDEVENDGKEGTREGRAEAAEEAEARDAKEETHTHSPPPPPPPPPPTLAVINCHLEGHPRQYAARIQQLHHAMDDLAKRRRRAPSTNPKSPALVTLNALTIAGDFNCELQSSACATYLRLGRVGKKGGLGGVHGTSALSLPPSILHSAEAAEILHPIIEWGNALPDEENGWMEKVVPHPFRRNCLTSAYPVELGQRDATTHFTYCANPNRPVAGLDQIWSSGSSLTRVGLRRMFAGEEERNIVLASGLPNVDDEVQCPSDHLPIGAVFDWNLCDPADECSLDDPTCRSCSEAGVRELYIAPDRKPTQASSPKPKSPIMAYAELDILLLTCPYDSDEQRTEIESIMDHVPDLPANSKEKPSPEQMAKLREMRERKKVLLMDASDSARQVLRRILKLKKEVAGY